MFEVIYFSRGGNTAKVANAIAEELGVTAQDVKTVKNVSKDSYLVIGSGCYGSKPGKELLDFIRTNDFKGRKIALFGSSASPEGGVDVMDKLLVERGAEVTGKFNCRGKFLFMNQGRPNEEDLDAARKFARWLKKV